MRLFLDIFKGTFIIIIMASFSQCSSAQHTLEDKAPEGLKMTEAYYQVIPPGIREGDTTVKIYMPMHTDTQLDSIFFRGQQAKFIEENGMYVATLVEASKEKYALGEGEPNTAKPREVKELPFKLEAEECVISYEDAGKTKYFKIDQLHKKELLHLPPMRVNKNKGSIKQ